MNGKLKFSEKLGYGFGELAGTVNSLFGAFLTMFYTDNMGMAAGAVGTMFLISKIFDGISDILAGTLIDHTKSKWGKARPWLLWLSVPTGLAIILIVMMPTSLSETGKLVYAFITYNLFCTVFYTIIGVAKGALMPLMTQDGIERGQLAMFTMIFGFGGVMVGSAVTFPFINAVGGGLRGWRIVFCVYGIIVTCGLLASFFMTREHVQAVSTIESGKQEAIPFGESMKMFFKNKYFIFALLVNILLQLNMNMTSGSQTFFFRYTMGDEMLMSTVSVVNVIPLLISILVLTQPALKKFGKKKCAMIGIVTAIVSAGIKGIAGVTASVPLLIAGTIISGLGTGLMSIPINILVADAVDYGEYKFNKRIEGTGSAVVSFSQKIAVGLSSAAVGWVLQLTGYVANQTQSATTNNGIVSLYAWIPMVMVIIMLVLYAFFYHYDKEEGAVMAELNRRKEAASAKS